MRKKINWVRFRKRTQFWGSTKGSRGDGGAEKGGFGPVFRFLPAEELAFADDLHRAGIHQRLAHARLKLLAARDNVDLESIESATFDFDPGVPVVVGTPHLGHSCRIIPPDLFDGSVNSHVQSKPRNNLMNIEPHLREQGIRQAATRQLLRMIRVTNEGWPVEIILTNDGDSTQAAPESSPANQTDGQALKNVLCVPGLCRVRA
jgi:hypothetical protein